MQRAEDFFERAQGYAVAALPYFHRRLGSVKCAVDVKPTAVVLRVDEWHETQALKTDSKISR
jgi:hypothetical protein